jgi:hypothetical protein
VVTLEREAWAMRVKGQRSNTAYVVLLLLAVIVLAVVAYFLFIAPR